MKLKSKSVNVSNLRRELWFALGVSKVVYLALGADLVITSGNDSKHGKNSLHYKDRAVDIRTSNLGALGQLKVKAAHVQISSVLEPMGFDVVLESDHIHIEFDPKAGESFLGVL